MSKAAEKLFISQPAMSVAIANLEKELGVKLFERNWDGVRVSEYGENIIEPIREIFRNIELIKERTINTDKIEEISIVSVPVFSAVILPQILVELQKNYPNVTIKSSEKSSIDISYYAKEKHKKREFMLVALTGDINQTLNSAAKNGYQHLFLAKDRLCCIAGKDDFGDVTSISIAQCANKTILEYASIYNDSQNSANVWRTIEGFKRHSEISTMELLLEMVKNNTGIGFFPTLLLHEDKRILDGSIRILGINEITEQIEYYLIYPNDTLAPFEVAFIELVKEKLAFFNRETK